MKIKKIHNICIDGSYNNTNGSSGIGIYDIMKEKKIFYKIIGIKSRTEAEEEALKHALIYVKKNNIEKFRILTDCYYIMSEYKHKLIKFEKCEDVIWIPRELNSIADSLANEGRNNTEEIYTKYKMKIETKKSYDFKIKNHDLVKKEKTSITIEVDTETRTPLTEISLFIKNNYSLNSKRNLIKLLSENSDLHIEKIIFDVVFNNAQINNNIKSKLIKNNLFLFAFSIIHKNERSENFKKMIKKYHITKCPNSKEIEKLLNRILKNK